MKNLIFVAFLLFSINAQSQVTEGRGGFKKENLFTGGGITLSFSNNGSVLGASPVFGYSIAKWIDAGIVLNYIYSSTRHVTYYNPGSGTYFYSDDKLRQSTYGPGAFLRLYPVKFLFAHAQFEHNFISQKLIPVDGTGAIKDKTDASSFLVGGGYCNGRENRGDMFYYISILFDVLKDPNSPYVENTQSNTVNVLPIIRAGIQIPLFQGRKLF